MSDRSRDDSRPAGARGDDPVRKDLEGEPRRDAGPDDLDVERIAPDEATQGAEVGEARLAGVTGIGTLQVVRGREGDVLRIEGTWRPFDESTDASAIESAISGGSTVRYEGKLDDPSHPEQDRCDVEVVLTSRSEYTWDARAESDGRTLPLYNFRPREGEAVGR